MTNQTAPEIARPRELQPPVEPRRSPVHFNALKHGILSVSPVIPFFEREEDWQEFRGRVFESINPQGGLQEMLTDRVCTLGWRLMRLVRYERETVTRGIMDVARDMRLAEEYAGVDTPKRLTPRRKREMEQVAMTRLLPDDQTTAKLLRYEGRLHRHLLQTIHQIKLLKGLENLPSGSSLGQPNIDAPATRLFGKESGAAGYNGGAPHT